MSAISDKIKSRGYWKIVFRPTLYKTRIVNLSDCKSIIEANAVNLRGWDFPHIPRREGEGTGLLSGDNYYEGWVDWSIHKEIWRFYQSAQFITYRGYWEDWGDENLFSPQAEHNMSKLGVLHTIYQITEAYEFLSGLSSAGLFPEGVSVQIQMINKQERELWLEDASRVPFMWERKTGATSISYDKDYSAEQIKTNSLEEARRVILHVFKRFDWEPAEELIIKAQEDLLRRRR